MSDLKLFRISTSGVAELPGASAAVEKTLQDLMERNLDAFLGVRFLASEYSTGKTHGGRIDTLGIDENGSPVIIEYKRSLNENVINQGLFYLDWLMDHKAEFTLLAMECLGSEAQNEIDWSAPRLLCIAGDFTRYDQHAVSQINRNIELLRYRRYGDELMLLELVNARSVVVSTSDPLGTGRSSGDVATKTTYKSVAELTAQAPPDVRDLNASLEAFLLALGDDVQRKELKFYVAFRRIKNFACVEVHPQAKKVLAYLKVDPDDVALEPGLTRDVRSIGHYGTGDLEVTLSSPDDFERTKHLFVRSYELS